MTVIQYGPAAVFIAQGHYKVPIVLLHPCTREETPFKHSGPRILFARMSSSVTSFPDDLMTWKKRKIMKSQKNATYHSP